MTDQARPISRPWRRFLRFSVRGLIVFVVVLGAGLGWIVRQAHIQRDAVAAIRKAGGTVSNDWEWNYSMWKDGKSIRGGKPWAPRWLVDLIGTDFFGHVAVVDCRGASTATDATLAHVGPLNRLQWLTVNHASVSDAGLVHLKGLTNLSVLWLDDTQVTDVGLVHLTGLTSLSNLGLDGIHVTDAGLVHLKGLTNLSVLGLNRIQVTDAGLVHLKGLTNLSVLGLDGTQVTDAGLVHLKGLTRLSNLGLNGSQVTDAGMNELKRTLPGLTIHHP